MRTDTMCDTISLPLVYDHLLIIHTQGICTNLSKNGFHPLPQRSGTSHYIDASAHIHRDPHAVTGPQTAFLYKHSQTYTHSFTLGATLSGLSFHAVPIHRFKRFIQQPLIMS